MEVAEAWATGGSDTQAMLEDARVMGLKLDPSEIVTNHEVWSENEHSVDLFFSLATQWRWTAVGMGASCLGLDYAGVDAVMRMQRIKQRKEIFTDIQIMEAAALKCLNGKGT
ncbi:MAG: DUF1799 domain-containing protein [Pseudomonadota bacterium]